MEQIVNAPVMQAVEELAEVSKVFSQDRIQQRIVEQTIPAIPLAEKIVELPVIQTEEKTRQGVNTHAQHVVDTVEVERPKIIDETVQKPIIQEKINPVTKHVDVPLSQFTGKAMDIPVVAQRQISTEIVQKTIEISQLKHTDHVDDVPAVLVVEQVPQVQVMAETAEIPLVQFLDKVDDIPVVVPRQILPMAQTVQKTIETQQLQCIDKVIDVPVVLVAQVSQLLLDVQAPTMQVVEKTVEDTQLQIVVEKTTDDPTAAAQYRSTQQHKSSKHQPTKQAMQQRERKEEKGQGEEERRGEKEREENGRKSEEKGVRKEDEEGDSKVDWTVVTRNRRQRKMVQIFVKVNGSKATPMEVNLTDDKVEDVMRQIQKDEDVYVTMHGKC